MITCHGTHTLNFAFVLFLHPFGVIFNWCSPTCKPASTTGEEPANHEALCDSRAHNNRWLE